MKKILRNASLVLAGVFLVFSAFSCSQQPTGVSQQEYDSIKSQLDAANSQIADLKAQVAQLQAQQSQYTQLNTSYEALKKQDDANIAQINTLQSQVKSLQSQVTSLTGDKQTIQASYDDLQAKYQDLQQKYNALIAPGQPITEDAVEQAIFDQINLQRSSHNLPLLSWGRVMYQTAKLNSQKMAADGKYEYAEINYFQQLFWAAGYNSVDSIAHGAMLIWTNNQYQFEHGMLSTAFKYCAIGAYQQGDVVYVTMMMSDFP